MMNRDYLAGVFKMKREKSFKMEYDKKNNIYLLVLKGIFIALIVYILVFIAFNYNKTFIHPEVLCSYPRIFSKGYGLSLGDFRSMFDFVTFENAPRPRILAHLVEIYNAKFRIGLLNFMPYHPSFSLNWLFVCLLSPLLLFKFVKNINNNKAAPWIALIIYFSSMGTLSGISMFFRPTKILGIFFLLLSFWLASILKKHLEQNDKINFPEYFLLLLSLFLGFLSDETTLFTYLIIPVIFYQIFFKSKNKISICLLYTLPALVFIVFAAWIAPFIAIKLHYVHDPVNIFNFMFSGHTQIRQGGADWYSLSSKMTGCNLYLILVGARNMFRCIFPFPLNFPLIWLEAYILLLFSFRRAPSEKNKNLVLWGTVLFLFIIFQIFVYLPREIYYYGSMFTIYIAILLSFILTHFESVQAKLYSISGLIIIVIFSLTMFEKWNCVWMEDLTHPVILFNKEIPLMKKNGDFSYYMAYKSWKNRKNINLLIKTQPLYPAKSFSMFYEYRYSIKNTTGMIKKAPWPFKEATQDYYYH